MSALQFVHGYLQNHAQRTKINSKHSSWEEIIFRVPQGFILEPLLFNMLLYDLFLIMENTDFASYVDDNMAYATGNSNEEVILKLEDSSKTLSGLVITK